MLFEVDTKDKIEKPKNVLPPSAQAAPAADPNSL
jgi:hypothetical protein